MLLREVTKDYRFAFFASCFLCILAKNWQQIDLGSFTVSHWNDTWSRKQEHRNTLFCYNFDGLFFKVWPEKKDKKVWNCLFLFCCFAWMCSEILLRPSTQLEWRLCLERGRPHREAAVWSVQTLLGEEEKKMGQVKPGGVHKDGVLCFAMQTRNNVNGRCFYY